MNLMTRTMILMDAGASRFQVRVGALIWSNGHILVHRAAGDTYWALPGGRVELHEPSPAALAREIEEEIGCPANIGSLRFIIENFFELDGRKAHEIGFYFDTVLSRPLPFHSSEIVHRSRDGEAELEFRWASPTASALDALDLKPAPFRELIETLPTSVAHHAHYDHAK
ncbi:NUDIX hydrolase [Sinorhizobium sojae]|uniref:NUDIX hydrolase n=1 Tax=Sinorhizobium sojae TaxID=716925 RepID=UPI00054D22D8|nr:NUDIX domain-containing protein [Sinorhizobium sojae]